MAVEISRRIDVAGEIDNPCVLLQRRYYRMFGGYVHLYGLQKQIARVKKTRPFAHWHGVGSQSVQDMVRRVDLGYRQFLRKQNKRPPKLRQPWQHKSPAP
ncbi:hypothetical protein NKDENANG_03817 [Candidatus Entotheonellaceae bacterium PAL068K]